MAQQELVECENCGTKFMASKGRFVKCPNCGTMFCANCNH